LTRLCNSTRFQTLIWVFTQTFTGWQSNCSRTSKAYCAALFDFFRIPNSAPLKREKVPAAEVFTFYFTPEHDLIVLDACCWRGAAKESATLREAIPTTHGTFYGL
jgi:hypothetical protein